MSSPSDLRIKLRLPPSPGGSSPKRFGPRPAPARRGLPENAAAATDGIPQSLPHELLVNARVKGAPLVPAKVAFPKGLQAESWQDSRSALARIRMHKTGLSERLREVEVAFEQAGLGLDPLDDPQVGAEGPGARMKSLKDLRESLETATTHAEGISKQGQNVTAVLAGLSDLKRQVAGRIAFFGQEDSAGAMYRASLYRDPFLGSLLAIQKNAPSLISRANELLAGVETMQDARKNLNNSQSLPWRTLGTYPVFWPRIVKEHPEILKVFGESYIDDAITESIRSVGSGAFLKKMCSEIDTEQDGRQAVSDASAYNFDAVRIVQALEPLRQEVQENLPTLPGRLDRLLAWLEDPKSREAAANLG